MFVVAGSLASYVPSGGPRCTAPSRSRPRLAAPVLAETAVVTDGTDSFFGSRTVFQTLFDNGDFSSLTAFSSSVVDAKKMCISRQARYSGLIDVLKFAEGGDAELATAFADASTWVAINADTATLPAQIAAAGQAGVKRIFIHLSAADAAPADASALTAALDGSGAAYTVMRTGTLAKAGAGGGLLVSDLDMPVCEEVSLDDAFRFLTEALAIPEASGRLFSLCPTTDDSQLKQMRMAGCTRKEEAEALLKGIIKEMTPEEKEAGGTAAEIAEAKEEDPRSAEEKAAAAEEEVKKLLAKAREKGIENQKRMAKEEAEKQAKREERAAYFAQNMPDDEEEGKGGASDDDDKPDPKPDAGGDGGDGGSDGGGGGGDDPKKKGDDDDGLALV